MLFCGVMQSVDTCWLFVEANKFRDVHEIWKQYINYVQWMPSWTLHVCFNSASYGIMICLKEAIDYIIMLSTSSSVS